MDPAPEPKKRIRREPETTRRLILDATAKLMVEEGYAAVTTRRVAKELGLTAALVHYYYPTTDDLFIALHRDMTDKQEADLSAVLRAPMPLHALWEFQSGWTRASLGVEFMALANHRKAIREDLVIRTEEARARQAAALGAIPGPVDVPPEGWSPAGAMTLLVAVARTLANEEAIGITSGHAEARRFVQWALSQLEQPADGECGDGQRERTD